VTAVTANYAVATVTMMSMRVYSASDFFVLVHYINCHCAFHCIKCICFTFYIYTYEVILHHNCYIYIRSFQLCACLSYDILTV